MNNCPPRPHSSNCGHVDNTYSLQIWRDSFFQAEAWEVFELLWLWRLIRVGSGELHIRHKHPGGICPGSPPEGHPWIQVLQRQLPLVNLSCQPKSLLLLHDIYLDRFCHSMKPFLSFSLAKRDCPYVTGKGKAKSATRRLPLSHFRLLWKPLHGLRRLSRLESICLLFSELCSITFLLENLQWPNKGQRTLYPGILGPTHSESNLCCSRSRKLVLWPTGLLVFLC